MTKNNICLYCGCELTVGINWTEGRQKNHLYNCRTCSSAIARGRMSRKDRLIDREYVQPEYNLSSTNLVEMMGKRGADRRIKLQQHVASQITDEIKASLRRTDASIVKVFNIKKQSFEK